MTSSIIRSQQVGTNVRLNLHGMSLAISLSAMLWVGIFVATGIIR